ncbi:ABC transporter permease [Nitrospirillum iridis]|uniref:Putative ABC transport system permease protein n=1 Tax=Nitrospirillum iridis TaxID=765888 RepID=A0A7X0AY03_9PROT|nr:ABC transporter permease [Nitrospirillum iridis]MBB6251170.1 putative ABC transport system permease protein [Nitrospirillum iridis]
MSDLYLLWRNLFRRKLRTFLMMLAIFVAFVIYGVLGSINYAFEHGVDSVADNRLVVTNKITFIQPMPFAYVNKIAAVKGVKNVTYASWFGGYYQDPRNQIGTYAVDPESYMRVYRDDLRIDPEAHDTFIHDRTTMLVGEAVAKKYGWKAGDRIPLNSNIFTNKADGSHTWELTVAGIAYAAKEASNTNFILFQHENFNESKTFGKDTVGWITLETDSATVNDKVAAAIDDLFANSTAETNTQSEKAFGKAFLAQLGNIALIITLVVGAAFATILMIVGNTMVMAVRERTKEIAVLKTLGFPSWRIWRQVLGESVLLALLGGVPGLAVAALLVTLLAKGVSGAIPGLALTLPVTALGVGFMVLLGLITGFVPAWTALRLNIVTALGRL